MFVGGLVYNTAAPSPTDGQSLAFQSDSAGNLKVATVGTTTVVPASGSTVTIVPSGTQTVTGTVTNVPSGTQTVTGTVTTVPSGTQNVTGTVAITGILPETTGIVAHYDTVETVAASSTGTISYTVTTNKTLFWKGIIATSSGGPCKVTVDYGAGPTIVHVGFYSTASPFLHVTFPQPLVITEDVVVNVKIRNDNDTAQDVYATIFGVEYDE